MTKTDFFFLLEEVLDGEPGSLTGNESFRELKAWDSLAMICLISLVEERFGTVLAPEKIVERTTVAELAELAAHTLAIGPGR